ncbi:MAG: hypothetical protein M1395_05555 [Bacteroidetes bacterium]|nr:hypothetical protein [Bacteroidota bacterium]
MRRLVEIASDSANYTLYSYSGGKLSKMEIVNGSTVVYSIQYMYDDGNRPSSGLISNYGSDTTEAYSYDADGYPVTSSVKNTHWNQTRESNLTYEYR